PGEIVPIADLPFEIAHFFRAFAGRRHRFDLAGVISGVDGSDVTDSAIVNSLVELTPRRVIAPAKTGDERQVLFLGGLCGFEDGTDSRGIGRHRLFAKDVFARVHGGFEVDRPEAGWRGEQNDVHPALDHLLVCVQADETVVRSDLYLVR